MNQKSQKLTEPQINNSITSHPKTFFKEYFPAIGVYQASYLVTAKKSKSPEINSPRAFSLKKNTSKAIVLAAGNNRNASKMHQSSFTIITPATNVAKQHHRSFKYLSIQNSTTQ
jgi:hypothetical protein